MEIKSPKRALPPRWSQTGPTSAPVRQKNGFERMMSCNSERMIASFFRPLCPTL